MTIVYVDLEHERVRCDPVRGDAHTAKLATGAQRVATAAGQSCEVVHFSEVSADGISRLAPSAIVLSGSTTDWGEYDFETLAALLGVIRAAPVPILGICAGHQLIGYAHGARWGALGALEAGELDPAPRFAPGNRKERGFLPVDIDPGCSLFRGLGRRACFFQSHYWHLHEAPERFVVRGRSPFSPVQAMESLDGPVFGVQFHPERYDSVHPDGETMLQNFFALAAS